MPTYIEREALTEKLIYGNTDPIEYRCYAKRFVETAPPADVAPVRRGKLISTGYDELYCDFGNCTLCGADQPMSNKFCCNCGADMREV
jgi:hypothetical protein